MQLVVMEGGRKIYFFSLHAGKVLKKEKSKRKEPLARNSGTQSSRGRVSGSKNHRSGTRPGKIVQAF